MRSAEGRSTTPSNLANTRVDLETLASPWSSDVACRPSPEGYQQGQPRTREEDQEMEFG